jgi:precorrin-2 dehydrogenase / sirohydrochlorin ferrochelatase
VGYPVLLHLQGRQVVVVGGGQVASRKIGDLLASGANILVISPALTEPLKVLVERGALDWREERYVLGTLQTLRPFLVFAVSDSPEVNARVVSEAQTLGILVGAADGEGDFTSMAAVRRGAITLAAATDGASPALAAHLRERLETAIGEEYGTLAEWLAELRPLVQQHIPTQAARRTLWQAIVASPVLEHLRKGDAPAARETLNQLLNEAGVQEALR